VTRTCDDLYESLSDDTAATTNSLGAAQVHSIHTAGESDYVRLAMISGHVYTFSATGVGASLNAMLRLYDSNGTTLISTADASGLGGSETLTYTATSSATRFLRVTNTAGTGGCTGYGYTLAVSAQADFVATQDNFIWQANATTNYGADQWIGFYNVTGQGVRTLVQFNITTLPAGATITAGTLNMRQVFQPGGSTNITVTAHQINAASAWNEGTGTLGAPNGNNSTWNRRITGTNWGTAGGDFSAAVLDTVTLSANNWYAWNVLGAVQSWYGGATNNGLLLQPTNFIAAVNYKAMASSEYGTAADRPYLRVTYTPA
jgi:hypothetical protein